MQKLPDWVDLKQIICTTPFLCTCTGLASTTCSFKTQVINVHVFSGPGPLDAKKKTKHAILRVFPALRSIPLNTVIKLTPTVEGRDKWKHGHSRWPSDEFGY